MLEFIKELKIANEICIDIYIYFEILTKYTLV